MKKQFFLCFIFTALFYNLSLAAITRTPIAPQTGQDIICSGPNFTYSHDVRQHGVDTNLKISGDAALAVETGDPYASFYTDTTKGGDTAVFEYSFVAENGSVFGNAAISSKGNIFSLACSITADYKIGDGPWINFLTLTSGEIRPIDLIEDIHSNRITIRYTVNWINAYWPDSVQLFRSWSSAPGIPGDFAFTFTTSLVTDSNCHKANLIGQSIWIDSADLAVLASDFGQTDTGLDGDIDDNGTCDLADLQWLAYYWLCDCYE